MYVCMVAFVSCDNIAEHITTHVKYTQTRQFLLGGRDGISRHSQRSTNVCACMYVCMYVRIVAFVSCDNIAEHITTHVKYTQTTIEPCVFLACIYFDMQLEASLEILCGVEYCVQKF